MPDSKRDFESLLKEYEELQLRVTRFSTTEQELINARDRLDQELVSHRRLNDFIQNALNKNSNLDFVKLVAESIIDILEIEAAVVYFSNLGLNGVDIYHKEGLFLDSLNEKFLKDFLINQKENYQKERTHLWKGKDFPENLKNILEELMFFSFKDADSKSSFFLAGINTKQNAPFYKQLELRHSTIFSLFSQQVNSIYLNRQKSDKIQEQIEFISKSELELRKLSLIATKTKNGVIISNNLGQIEWVNDAFTHVTGYSLEEVKGKKPKDFLQSDQSDPQVLLKLKDALQNKKPIEVSIKNITKNKRIYINQLEIIPVFDEFGNHTNFIALQKDITAETAFKDELVRVNSRFELITESSKIGIWEKDFTTNSVTWNDILFEQYGISKLSSTDLYQFWIDSIHSDDREFVMENIKKIISNKIAIIEQEYRIYNKSSGEIKFLNCLTIAEKNEFGAVIRLVGSSIDITERKKNEDIIKQQNESLKHNLVEIESGKHRIEEINQSLEKRIKEATEKNLQLAKSISDQEKLVTIGEIASGVAHDLNTPLGAIKIGAESILFSLDKLFNEAIEKCNFNQLSFAFERSRSNEIVLFMGGLKLRKEMLLFRDYLVLNFPEIKEIELTALAELFVKCNFKLTERDDISKVIQFNNRLDFLSLINQIQLIRSFIQTVVNSGEKAAKIVQDMKSFVKDQKNFGVSKINLNSNISSVLNIFNYEIHRKCSLKFEVSHDLFVHGYEIKLFQLWSNIIKNAIEAIEDSGKSGEIYIYSEEFIDKIRVVFQNNGPKIPEEVISKIFSKFYTTKAHKNGSGIGLSIAMNIIEEHKASISIKSNDTQTEFLIDFPKIDW
jgi:PAS domain S-box-containing protein